MRLNGMQRDIQAISDFQVGVAQGDQLQHLQLTLAQRVLRRPGRRGLGLQAQLTQKSRGALTQLADRLLHLATRGQFQPSLQ